MSDNGSLIFDSPEDLKPVEVPVRVYGKDYILKEATEGDVAAWRNLQLRQARYQGGTLVSVGEVADSESLLVSLCLYKALKDKDTQELTVGPRVSQATVKQWPTRFVKPIFERAKEISGLNEPPANPDALEKTILRCATQLMELKSKDVGLDPVILELRTKVNDIFDGKKEEGQDPNASSSSITSISG